MNVITKLKAVKERNFKVGDIVRIIEVTNIDMEHKEYCEKFGNIKAGTLMRVYKVTKKDEDEDEIYCTENDRIICNKVCKDYCISLEKIDNPEEITHSCYSRFEKVNNRLHLKGGDING